MEKVKLTIDNKTVEVPKGTTIAKAAKMLGIDIPLLCH
ncbi:MAG TPA: 2Fe-2S iron-sulfur cluster-binding protein, partial [Bacteroidales bacterium]|nr:2Fe-2S iron-sulfur cluster-binding protein [Bacteroidales bacterium]HOM41310.1 2Fe-2S iron-sulfur cluster-binding protein [Bacteroidales bacterium]HQK70463.1 2Fe-2S iron-sulfur cluster-binding protein [Bacteroidales bacterium]